LIPSGYSDLECMYIMVYDSNALWSEAFIF